MHRQAAEPGGKWGNIPYHGGLEAIEAQMKVKKVE